MKLIKIQCAIFFTLVLFIMLFASCSTVQKSVMSGEAKSLKDCPDCPELVIIPEGSFIMGSPETEEGHESTETQHRVVISKPFAIGKYPVTKGEFRQFVAQSGYNAKGKCSSLDEQGNMIESEQFNWETPGFDQTDDDPVICVSAIDAEAYATWLSKKTGKNYRLPSESEYEYAARAGTTTARYWGESQDDGCAYANGHGYESEKEFFGKMANCDDGFVYTSPVGNYKPNAFGLYDMLGNAWVWCADCWHDDYLEGPDTEAPWDKEGCKIRVMHGGSFISHYTSLRAAARHKAEEELRYHNYGMRIARDVAPEE